MIHDIGVEMQAALRARNCNVPVVDGPEPTETGTYARERIVIERAADKFGPARSVSINPKRRFTASDGVTIRIFAQSSAPGATYWEHQDRADNIREKVLVAFEKVVRTRKAWFSLDGGRFVDPPVLKGTERPSGAVYELACTVQRAIEDTDMAREKAEEATGVTLINTTTVGEETACGG